MARAADKQAVETAARAARDGAQRERERHEAATRRFRLEAETAQKEAERCASLLNRAELVAARDKKEAEAALVAERAAFDATVAKRDAAIRELKVARDARFSRSGVSSRRAPPPQTRPDASSARRGANARRAGAGEARAREPRGVAESPKRDAFNRVNRVAETDADAAALESRQERQNQNARTSRRALLSRAGGVRDGASARTPPRRSRSRAANRPANRFRRFRKKEKKTKTKTKTTSAGARLPPVSLEDLEKSPSWQLQRRLESLEARAAALLLDEEEEAARR